MKTFILLTAILLSLMVGCNLEDSGNPAGSGGGGGSGVRDTSGVIDNSSGVYDGSWILVTYNEEGMEKIVFDQYPEHSYIDSGGDMNTLTDTTEIIVLKGDSVALYEYDSDDGDTFTIDYFLLSSLDEEYDTTGIYNEMTGEVMELNEEGAPFEFTINANELYNGITLAGDTLRVELGLNYDISFSTDITNEEIADYFEIELGKVTGQYAVYEYILYEMVRYTGPIPPASWPENFVIDTGDGDDDYYDDNVDSIVQIIQHPDDSLFSLLIGSWEGVVEESYKKERITVTFSEEEFLWVTEEVLALYSGTDTLTGEDLAAYLAEQGKVYPDMKKGICKVRDGMLSFLWGGETEPWEFPFDLAMEGTVLKIYIQDLVLELFKKE